MKWNGNWITGTDDLNALFEVDPSQVQVILEDRLDDNTRMGSFAAAFLLRHGDSKKSAFLRARLMSIAEANSAAGYARALAIDTLIESSWTGRDEWLLARFKDPTLHALRDGPTLHRPLCRIVAHRPATWIPKVIPMIGGPAHDRAVSTLVQFHGANARAQALRPLLPWIADSHWSDARDRLRLLQSLPLVNLPECVPGLRIAVEKESGWPLRAVAEAIAHYKPDDAASLIKRALAREGVTLPIYRALLSCGGDLGDGQLMNAYEAYAIHQAALMDDPKAHSDHEAPYIGAMLTRFGGPKPHLRERVLARASSLASKNSEASRILFELARSWPPKNAERVWIDELSKASIRAADLTKLLARRNQLESHRDALNAIAERGGVASGCAAVLLNDQELMTSMLKGIDSQAQQAVLACARLLRVPLSLKLVEPLLYATAPIREAATAYLTAMDTPAARAAVWAKNSGKALILGSPGLNTDRWERALRKEALADDGPSEIFALLSNWGNAGHICIRVRDDTATLSFHDHGKEFQRKVSAEELAAIRGFLEQERIDFLPAYTPSVLDGVHYTFVHLARDGGYRVYMNNPELRGAVLLDGKSRKNDRMEHVYSRLARRFTDLVEVWNSR